MRNYLYIIFVILLYSNIYKTIYYSNNSINYLNKWLKEYKNNYMEKKKEKIIEIHFNEDDIMIESNSDLTYEDIEYVLNYLLKSK